MMPFGFLSLQFALSALAFQVASERIGIPISEGLTLFRRIDQGTFPFFF